MENQPSRPWYKKKRYLIPGGFIALLLIVSLNSNPTPAPAVQVQGTTTVAPAIQTTTNLSSQPQNTLTNTPGSNSQNNENNVLSNNNYYTNVDDNSVHSPAYSENTQAPDGATAECNDGTYSFSQNHSGTCSHHGGVEEWLN